MKKEVFRFERHDDIGVAAVETMEKLKRLGLDVEVLTDTEEVIEFQIVTHGKMSLDELPYEPDVAVQKRDDVGKLEHWRKFKIPMITDVPEWRVIVDCECELVAIVSADKANVLAKVLNQASDEGFSYHERYSK